MTGIALAETVRERIPAIRVLFATSRGVEDILRQGLQPKAVLRLDRTFDRRFVLLRIRESLTVRFVQ